MVLQYLRNINDEKTVKWIFDYLKQYKIELDSNESIVKLAEFEGEIPKVTKHDIDNFVFNKDQLEEISKARSRTQIVIDRTDIPALNEMIYREVVVSDWNQSDCGAYCLFLTTYNHDYAGPTIMVYHDKLHNVQTIPELDLWKEAPPQKFPIFHLYEKQKWQKARRYLRQLK